MSAFADGEPVEGAITAIVERDDIMFGKELVEIFGDVLAIPGIAAEAEDQRAALVRTHPAECGRPASVSPSGVVQPTAVRRFAAADPLWHGMNRKNEMALEIEHGGPPRATRLRIQ